MSIQGGVEFIAKKQREDGGFWEYNLAKTARKSPLKYRTTFLPSMIANALVEVPGSGAIRNAAAAFLVEQKSGSWSWNFWARSSKHHGSMPYPDDLDDTFLALAAVARQQESALSPAALAKIAQLLFATEVHVGGPYRTWLVDASADTAWQGVDIAVNANIGAFLELQQVTVPGVNEFVERALENGELTSPYYVSQWPILYFLSKWYRGNSAQIIQSAALAGIRQGINNSPQTTALAVTTLLNWGYSATKLTRAVEYVRSSQRKDGGWPAEAFSIGPAGQASGARALTTALCLEALRKYEDALKKHHATTTPVARSSDQLYIRLCRDASKKIKGSELRQQTLRLLQQMAERDSDGQIAYMPRLVAGAFGLTLNRKLERQLAEASVWGWMTYSTYDNFLDNEGDVLSLPGAAYAGRQLQYALAGALPGHRLFHDEVAELLTRIDQANAWELQHSRWPVHEGTMRVGVLPNYENYWPLVDRSAGHMIAGIGVLYRAGHGANSEKMQSFKSFFEAYLIARQLNDDAHDWSEDLRRGLVNVVAAKIITHWQKRYPQRETIVFDRDLEVMQRIFWDEVIDIFCDEIIMYVTRAREALRRSAAGASDLERLLGPLERAAGTALRSRDDAREFLSTL